ncbi:DUF3995 domain-containing protein [Glycomyces tenuis]|uniref:DUF3995 domain-containing protein n=1 Tax=Glycomyces tenuis TaxID=58116 RepID=UPI0003F4CD86|nr:DUF3995 domain-containing protein [Glycomyces tenuis]
MAEPNGHPTALNPAAWLLILWSLGFGGLSVFWACGGTWLADKVSEQAQQMAADRVWWFMLLLWLTAALKLGYGVRALAITRAWGRVFPRWLLLLGGWGAGLATLGYGAVQLALSLPVYTGAVEYANAPDRETLWWHVFVWQPVWIAGGLLVLTATLTYQIQSGRSRARAE